MPDYSDLRMKEISDLVALRDRYRDMYMAEYSAHDKRTGTLTVSSLQNTVSGMPCRPYRWAWRYALLGAVIQVGIQTGLAATGYFIGWVMFSVFITGGALLGARGAMIARTYLSGEKYSVHEHSTGWTDDVRGMAHRMQGEYASNTLPRMLVYLH